MNWGTRRTSRPAPGDQLGALAALQLAAAVSIAALSVLRLYAAAVVLAAVLVALAVATWRAHRRIIGRMTQTREEAEEHLVHRSFHDGLTGLPNRALFADRLAVVLELQRRAGEAVAVMFIDLDNFKVINDSRGHGQGDQVLTALARRLVGEVLPGDTVARFGGDEFVVLCERVVGAADALDIARRLQSAIATPLTVPGREALVVTASVGIALAGEGSSAAELLRDADAAVYRAKERGRQGVEVFDESLRRRVLSRADTEQALRLGLERGELVVHYQPEISLSTGEMVGVEALVRWNHPERGLVPPADFIPVAEESGLIGALGDVVLEQACRQLVAWRHAGLGDLTVSVNLSASQLVDSRLPGRLATIMATTGAPPDRLCVELTESALVADDQRVGVVLDELKALGVRLALDDFGTGYSSLAYLRRFPVDVVKVDRSFVIDLGSANTGAAIVAAVIGMASGMGMETIAEGVEEEVQLQHLGRLGCDMAQGFLLARPQEAQTIIDLAGHDLRAHPTLSG